MRLENAYIRLELDPKTGGFASLFNKKSGTELLMPGVPSRLFRLIAPDGAMLCNHIDSAAPQVREEDGGLVLTFEQNGVRTVATLALDGPAIQASIEITNTGTVSIEEVQFPCVLGIAPIENGKVTLPQFGKRSFDPFSKDFGGDRRHAEQYMHKMTARYPERMVTAWTDYSSDRHGIGLEARHTDFTITDFFVAKTTDKKTNPFTRSLDLAAAFPHRVKTGETWKTPPMRITLHEGDWHTVANAHRDWVETWIAKPARARKFVEGVGWHYFFLKHQDGSARFTYADLPRMAEESLKAGCPYILLFGWHEGGHDNHYFYRYVANRKWGGDTALRDAVAKVRAMGAEPIPFFNGTLANVNMPEHREFGHRWEARTREDAPYHAGDWAGFTVEMPTTNRARMHHEICPCAEHQEFFLKTMERLVHDYGFGNIQLDQISIKVFPCYNEGHGHEHPDRACIDGFSRLLADTRTSLRAKYPEGMMLAECTNEFTGQWSDGAWTWDFLENMEPILYSTPWLLTSTAIDALEFAETNHAFALKIMFDLRINGGDEIITEYPEFAEHVRRLAGLKLRVAPYYAWASFRDRDGIAAIATERPADLVASSFCDTANGKASIVLAEKAGKDAHVTLTPAWSTRTGEIRVESSLGETTTVPANAPLSLDLKPYEVRVLCFDI